MTLRAKLLLWYTGVFAVSGGLLVSALYWLVTHRMHTDADKFLDDEFEECARVTRALLDQPAQLEEILRREITRDRYFPLAYRLHDVQTKQDVLYLMDPDQRATLRAAAPIEGVPTRSFWTSVRLPGGDRPYRVLTAPLGAPSHPGLVLQVGMHTRFLEKRVASLREYLFIVLVFVVLVAAAGGWLLASRSLRPIDQLVADLGRIESSTLAGRLSVGASRDEVDRIREAINRMLERLERAFETLRSFTADAAHELRTPLSALQCRLEVAINKPRSDADAGEVLPDVLGQVAELSALVENLLLLARMDARPEGWDTEPVDLAALARDVCEPFALLAEEKGITLEVECHGEARSEGNPVLLRRLFGNLLDNAIHCTPAGGRVTVRTAADDDGCVVTVADTGVGIAPEALEHIFERFYRADESRSRAVGGAGLGLSIVRRAVELHHGRIAVESTVGQGTTMRVWLPREQPRPAAAAPPVAPG